MKSCKESLSSYSGGFQKTKITLVFKVEQISASRQSEKKHPTTN